jgi:hypothetical protein
MEDCDYCDYTYYHHHHCYWCGYTIVMSRVRNDGADEWEHVIRDAGWSVHTAKP